jgi:hypothetical protein
MMVHDTHDRRIDCRVAERLIASDFDGELDPSDQTRMREHLAHCSSCRSYRSDLTGIAALLDSSLAGDRPKVAMIEERVMASLERAREQRRSPLAPVLRLAAGILLAATLGFFLSRELLRPGPSRQADAPLVPPARLVQGGPATLVVHTGREERNLVPVTGGSSLGARVARDRTVLTSIPAAGPGQSGEIILELDRENVSLVKPVRSRWR